MAVAAVAALQQQQQQVGRCQAAGGGGMGAARGAVHRQMDMQASNKEGDAAAAAA